MVAGQVLVENPPSDIERGVPKPILAPVKVVPEKIPVLARDKQVTIPVSFLSLAVYVAIPVPPPSSII